MEREKESLVRKKKGNGGGRERMVEGDGKTGCEGSCLWSSR